jgi:DNA (cytosine-5)-methyltransferase 1
MFEYIRALAEIRPKWFLWENVPGVLNTRDDAFAQLLGEVQDIGYLSLAWRVLDAQFFGVAQRRRRVFLVGQLGSGGGAAAVLFESESVRGNTQTSKQKREELARATGRGADARGGAGGGVSDNPVAFKYSAGAAARTMPTYSDGSCNTLTADYHSPAVALQTGHTAGNGSGINTEDVSYTVSTSSDQAVAFAQNTRDEVRIVGGDEQTVGALAASPGAKQQSYVAQRMAVTQYGEDIAGTLTARHDSSPCADRGQNVLCMASAAANAEIGEQICPTIMAHAAKTPPIVIASSDECVGALCARDHKGVGSQYFEEGKVICQRVTSSKSVAEPTPTSSGTARLAPQEKAHS